jgi:dTDP-glucose 4,6-dehydratase
MREFKSILITGGKGFIGNNFIRYLLSDINFDGLIVNLDKPNYAGKIINIEDLLEDKRFIHEKGDINDKENNERVLKKYNIDAVVNFAAESNVDKSIKNPKPFIETNILGVFNLLEAIRKYWNGNENFIMHQVSTDEVYGSAKSSSFNENSKYDPRNPYSATKAASDHLIKSYYNTYNIPLTISNSSNNYGPFQYPDKLIPMTIYNALKGNEIPVHGRGEEIRDWLFVKDNNRAIWEIMKNGENGQQYNISGEEERENIYVVKTICDILSKYTTLSKNYLNSLITFVENRPGQDKKYSINCSKIKENLGWKQNFSFEVGLKKTVKWYVDNKKYLDL